MRDLLILLVHRIATLARLMGPGGLRPVVAESLLVKHQLLILKRSRHLAPNLRASDRVLAGVCALFMRPARVLRAAVVLRPWTILAFHRTLRACKCRWLFSQRRRRTGPQGPSQALVAMKRRNPRWGCPRIAQQIGLVFDRRWCMARSYGTGPPSPERGSRHSVTVGHAETGHGVEDPAGELHLHPLPRQRATRHGSADDRLVSIDRVLDHGAPAIA